VEIVVDRRQERILEVVSVLTTGTRDLFLSNTVRVHRKLREVGVAGRRRR